MVPNSARNREAVLFMNILLIKQSSLGDVLHSTGHIHAIKQAYPDSHLTLLTSTTCRAIYAHHPDVDHIVTVDRDRVKREALKHPVWAWRHMAEVVRQIKQREYDLAIDLQGLAKSVLFLYLAKAKLKVVKGNWWGLRGFRNKSLHAIDEMSGVLRCAGIDSSDVKMAFYTSDKARAAANKLLIELLPSSGRFIVISPFTRWASKNWPLSYSIQAARLLSRQTTVIISGAPADKQAIDEEIERQEVNESTQQGSMKIVNIAGRADLASFAEILRQAQLIITGDSFPMHLAVAVACPVLAMFGPTDETKTGPKKSSANDQSMVLRAPDCHMCDRAACDKQCLSRLSVEMIVVEAKNILAAQTDKVSRES